MTPPPPAHEAPGDEMLASLPLVQAAAGGEFLLSPPVHQAPVGDFRVSPPPVHPVGELLASSPMVLPMPPVGELLASSPFVHPAGELLAPMQPFHPVPAGDMLSTSTPSNMVMNQPCQAISWFRVSYIGGISLRCSPSVEAPWTGVTLPQMDVFAVAEEVQSLDGRVYLRLCDGRGWAFDDTLLMPDDPSVKRGKWMTSCDIVDPRVLQEVQACALTVRRRHPQPRGKRGGKRCSRRSKVASSLAGPLAVEV